MGDSSWYLLKIASLVAKIPSLPHLPLGSTLSQNIRSFTIDLIFGIFYWFLELWQSRILQAPTEWSSFYFLYSFYLPSPVAAKTSRNSKGILVLLEFHVPELRDRPVARIGPPRGAWVLPKGADPGSPKHSPLSCVSAATHGSPLSWRSISIPILESPPSQPPPSSDSSSFPLTFLPACSLAPVQTWQNTDATAMPSDVFPCLVPNSLLSMGGGIVQECCHHGSIFQHIPLPPSELGIWQGQGDQTGTLVPWQHFPMHSPTPFQTRCLAGERRLHWNAATMAARSPAPCPRPNESFWL